VASEVSGLRDEGASLEKVMGEVVFDGPLPLSDVVPDDADPGEAERFDKLVMSNYRLNVLLTYHWLEGTSQITRGHAR
jgi:hypothetical protein